jgi:SARP family transcriptional regulator, regulator of embCAB operon
VQLCGRLAVELAGRDVTRALPAGQGRVLFTYLAAHRHRELRREELADALWPLGAPEAAPSALAALLSRLRRAVGPAVLPAHGAVRLLLPADAWVDLEAAAAAVHRAESAVAQERWAEAWGPAVVALAIARRGLLPGHDAPWIAAHRRRLREIEVAALECYAATALGLGGCELPVGERVARDLIALAPFRESGHELLMQLLAARGNVAEALRSYEALRARLREELGATPSPRLRSLQARLLRAGEPETV